MFRLTKSEKENHISSSPAEQRGWDPPRQCTGGEDMRQTAHSISRCSFTKSSKKALHKRLRWSTSDIILYENLLRFDDFWNKIKPRTDLYLIQFLIREGKKIQRTRREESSPRLCYSILHMLARRRSRRRWCPQCQRATSSIRASATYE